MFLDIALGGTALAGIGSIFYLYNEPMTPAPTRPGKVLCDFHAHPCKKYAQEDLVGMLGSPGLVGLAGKFIDKSGEDILLYEEAVELCKKDAKFYEVTTGQLAKFREGYFARTQEIQAGLFHVLGIGFVGDYLQKYNPYSSVADAVKAIHAQQGVAVLNHPFFLSKGGLIVKPATNEEQVLIREGYRVADEVEVHNAYCINLIPGIVNATAANQQAEQLLREFPTKKGMSGSDCHRRISQVKITGNYLDQKVIDNEGIGGIKKAIVEGNFERHGRIDNPYLERAAYVDRATWIAGIAGDVISALK